MKVYSNPFDSKITLVENLINVHIQKKSHMAAHHICHKYKHNIR